MIPVEELKAALTKYDTPAITIKEFGSRVEDFWFTAQNLNSQVVDSIYDLLEDGIYFELFEDWTQLQGWTYKAIQDNIVEGALSLTNISAETTQLFVVKDDVTEALRDYFTDFHNELCKAFDMLGIHQNDLYTCEDSYDITADQWNDIVSTWLTARGYTREEFTNEVLSHFDKEVIGLSKEDLQEAVDNLLMYESWLCFTPLSIDTVHLRYNTQPTPHP